MINRLRKERIKRGLNEAQLAHVMGWSEQTILSLEAERFYPSAESLLRLAKYFNIHPGELFVLEADELNFNEVPEAEEPKAKTFFGFRLPWGKARA